VWSLTRSRRRWLAGRLLPVLALLLALSVVLWAVSDLVWSAREPWQPIPNFGDVGLHGSVISRKGRRRVGRRTDRGALLGRTLPAILVALAAGLLIAYVSTTLMSACL
jgi:ABC-type Na+ efflux pump permease subunit